MRVDLGPGYRLYFARRREFIILLLCGGDKSTQDRDITRAKAMVRDVED
jgi:putative addiction module killer protein